MDNHPAVQLSTVTWMDSSQTHANLNTFKKNIRKKLSWTSLRSLKQKCFVSIFVLLKVARYTQENLSLTSRRKPHLGTLILGTLVALPAATIDPSHKGHKNLFFIDL